MVTLPEPVKETELMFNENIQDEMYHEVSLHAQAHVVTAYALTPRMMG